MSGSGLLWMGRALILLQLFNGVLGWGKEGHYVVCKIAEVIVVSIIKKVELIGCLFQIVLISLLLIDFYTMLILVNNMTM